ncbi:2,4-dienoyl-CoA reductase-like NADH-dependent reductase (Old Yellow Enzyme family) [Streptomyces sp. CG 926]|uniref:NADH:flavin oxidoreductase/NADH oxidase family protein n=1 Tax=unclassified Streptomyces TaxID=2593676 RepID=UPI000D6D0648|nr:NADH:flavin oxidoreductase/NADH oxidase family protein [Streptomyces sp. CG 926]PWK74582.1 2,4-dienoyl-CoA reductase-like NADH-dependent reductase (Old Yellow Enzyme family) [Streptomyces sp. CG 926]
MNLFTPFELPCKAILPNRIAKAAMEESLAVQPGQLPGREIVDLYRRWAVGGSGLLITGNVMVDPRALTSPGTIVLDGSTPLDPFRQWAAAVKTAGATIWMQINHPGRQVSSDMPGIAWAPSDIGIDLGKHTKAFARPTAMTSDDIEATIRRFAVTAARAEEAGFDGVQIHAAHGYLLSTFLSPLVNRRTDRWGGSLINRTRILTETVRAVRQAVSPGFAVAVKLNAADFQRGGFDIEESAEVIDRFDGLGVDLVELSGGTVESAATMGRTADRRKLDREAYFLTLAGRLADNSPVPLMLTGGIGRLGTAENVLDRGFAAVGMARALALEPELPARWREGTDLRVTAPRLDWKDQDLAAAGALALTRAQLKRLANGRSPRARGGARLIFGADLARHRGRVRRYKAWLAAHPPVQAPEAPLGPPQRVDTGQ